MAKYTLQELRMRKNVSKEDVATVMGLSMSTYRNYEGANYIPYKYLPALCRYFGVATQDINTKRQQRRLYNGKLTKPLPFDLASLRSEFNYTKSTIMDEVGIGRWVYNNVEQTNATPPEFYDAFVRFYERHGKPISTIETLQNQVDALTKRVQALEQLLHVRGEK